MSFEVGDGRDELKIRKKFPGMTLSEITGRNLRSHSYAALAGELVYFPSLNPNRGQGRANRARVDYTREKRREGQIRQHPI